MRATSGRAICRETEDGVSFDCHAAVLVGQHGGRNIAATLKPAGSIVAIGRYIYHAENSERAMQRIEMAFDAALRKCEM